MTCQYIGFWKIGKRASCLILTQWLQANLSVEHVMNFRLNSSKTRNIEILCITKWYVRIWSACPKLGPRLVNNCWWPVYEWRRAVKRDFALRFCFFGVRFFLSGSKNSIHRTTFKLPRKDGEQILKAIWSFRRDQKCVLRNNAIKLFSYLFNFPFCKVHATAYSLLFILFEDQGCLWFVSIIFFTQLKK